MVHHNRLDASFAALSDPTRRGILERLERSAATVGELAAHFEMTLTGIAKHVGLLERAGMVTTEKRGRTRRCHLGSNPLDQELTWLQGHRSAIDARLDRLENFLERTEQGP